MVDGALLERLEKLSMVEVADKEAIKNELNEIVSFVEILNELDADAVSATFNTLEANTPVREDTPKKSDVIETVLSHAPNSNEGFFIVPKIIER